MKIRFHGNSLRLRLSQPDVTRLAESGSIAERVEFPGDRAISFFLESSDHDAAALEANAVRVMASQIREWTQSDREAIEFQSGPLKILIEKDFQCLHKDAPHDADAFPNPMVDRF